MTQKVIKVSDSIAVVIPKRSLKDLGIRPGDKVNVEIDKKQRVIIY
ncbi:MAG: AbrB/MazE/SpoVT family DNA-binding domain-containing protein [Candidatus Zambryskibacteria bacterium]|nr:AbrB/MazE/SpoVT family DNA-binding domain-containing protein [Candidatus Zambryskibacteria bacterium]